MRLSIRFQPWIVTFTVALVVVLTIGFMLAVFGKFQGMAETNARDRFAIMADRAAVQLDSTLRDQGRFLTVLSGAGQEKFSHESMLQPDALVPLLTSALNANPGLYSIYFGLDDGQYLQVVAVRGQSAVQTSLGAPLGTEYAVRRIRAESDSSRTEHWDFMNTGGTVLASTKHPAEYNPAVRPWYLGAKQTGGVYVTPPYQFASTGELGVSVGVPLPDGHGALGADTTLRAFREFLDRLPLSKNGVVMILDSQNRVLGLSARSEQLGAIGNKVELKTPDELGNPLLERLVEIANQASDQGASVVDIAGEEFVLAHNQLQLGQDGRFRILTIAPLLDFTDAVVTARRDTLLTALGLLLFLSLIAWMGTYRASKAMRELASNSDWLRQLDFSRRPHEIQSFLREVNALGDSQQMMFDSLRERTAALESARAKLLQVVETGISMGRDQDRQKLLRDVLHGAREVANCQAVTLYTKTENDTLRFTVRTSSDDVPDIELPLYDPKTGEPEHRFVSTHVALTGEIVVIDDIYTETKFDLSGPRRFNDESGMRVISMLTVPLTPHEGKVIGVLQLMNCLDEETGNVIPFPSDMIGFVEALAGQVAVTLENKNLLQAQKDLVDSMIKILAGAIDAKSTYTGGHCARVPELAFMLADAASRKKDGPLAAFGFKSENEWEEFRIGAWLHDCGKVTTPEYVVDKATKLETIYNRIHEVRMRFEVLLRDAEIDARKAIAEGQDADRAWNAYEERKKQLQDDFAFVAESNLGGEFMAPERIERIKAIAGQTWMRHFSDRLGLAHLEELRLSGIPEPALPTQEQLLADKPEHLIPRSADDKALDESHGFKVKVPQYLYNHGEIYNLCIGRGTLNEEERFKINEHIIQTIVMLEEMPFPEHLKRVPEYAGTHHETLIGTGYPRKLTGEQMTVPMRIMAIADLFEALTASDRPYKKGKTLSEAVKILSFFKKDQHIDPDLFDLLLTSGVYKKYAERYLKPEQIDEVNVEAYLG
jgi:HD-GYP domain-containing protein (c-di-GMP phosphodiesterase class II)